MASNRRFLLCLLLSIHLASFSSAASDDAAAMSELAKSLTNVPSSWIPGTDPCGAGSATWENVKCSSGRVTGINLVSKSIAGTLPAAVAQLTFLQQLFLQGNHIFGPLPTLSNLSSLQQVHVDGNDFSSIPDDFFSGLSSLTDASFDDNPFGTWILPNDIAQITTLQTFSASNTSVTGEVPAFFGELLNFRELSLSYNNLSGELPGSFAGSSIQILRLNNQKLPKKLSGGIDVVGAMNELSVVWLQSNNFVGPIPDVSNLTSLTSFKVRDNELTGAVPSSLIACQTLNEVALSNNKLQGPFPVFASKNITLDIDKGNNFCNPGPGDCDPRVNALLLVAAGFENPLNLATSWEGNDPCAGGWTGVVCDPQAKNITVLNFGNQHFSGTISPDIANLTSLTKLLLSNNNLTGVIPDSLAKLPQLQLLDVSNNNLSGKVPDFPSSVQLKLTGNSLLESSLSPVGEGGGGGSGSPTDGTSSDVAGSHSGSSSSSSTGLIAGLITASVVLIGCSGGFLYYRRHKNQGEKFGKIDTRTPPNEPEMIKIGIEGRPMNNGAMSELYSQSSTGSANIRMLEDQGMVISIHTLRKATNNFSEENILGRGGFGVVYRGDLNGTLVAVKRNETDLMGQKGMAEFQAEIDVLKKVRHRHLVALLGYCVDGPERLLIYEFMPEGTLGEHLFDSDENRRSSLTWKQRLTIALDVARGIEYLHSLAQESFIHRDLKPSNILLDKDMRAKVSDFGLVKLVDNKNSMMTRLAGTFGYLAPEYALTGKISTKVDVYAFGVILMELIMGRRALNESLPEEQSHLVSYFRRIILDQVKFIKSVDATLNLDDEGQKSIIEVAELARHCTAREPNQRPDMSHAVNVLAPLVDRWRPAYSNDEDAYGDSGMSLSQRLENWQFDDCSSTSELFSGYKRSLDTTHGTGSTPHY